MEIRKVKGRKVVTIDGVTKQLYELAREFGIEASTLEYRIKAGWDRKSWFLPSQGQGNHTTKVMRKRGCAYCTDFVNMACKHEECPYHELDGFKTYDEYLKKGKKNGLVKMLEDLG